MAKGTVVGYGPQRTWGPWTQDFSWLAEEERKKLEARARVEAELRQKAAKQRAEAKVADQPEWMKKELQRPSLRYRARRLMRRLGGKGHR